MDGIVAYTAGGIMLGVRYAILAKRACIRRCGVMEYSTSRDISPPCGVPDQCPDQRSFWEMASSLSGLPGCSWLISRFTIFRTAAASVIQSRVTQY